MLRAFFLCIALIYAALPARATAADDPAQWGRRTALLIGNGAYKTMPLANPVGDVRLMADALKAARFKVIKIENGNREAMLKAISDFGDELDRGGVGLFYYAGHGVQVRGDNYLMPVDVAISREEEIRTRGVNAQEVLDRMASAKNGLNLVFLDACRNDPFPRASRSAASGLAKMDAAHGMLISFATAPGSVAEDGNTSNSPYTRHLAATIKTPGLRVEDVLKRVRASVRQETEGRQITWDNSSIEGEFFFLPGDAPAAAAAPVDTGPSADVAFWNSIKASDDPREFELYLKRYPKGEFAELARARLDKLQGRSGAEAPAAQRRNLRPQEAAKVASIRPTPVATARPNAERIAQARALFPRVAPESVTDADINTAQQLKERLLVIDETRARQQAAISSVAMGGAIQQYAEQGWQKWRQDIDRLVATKKLDEAEEQIAEKETSLGIEPE